MALLDKLMFWKKKDDAPGFDFGAAPNLGMGTDNMGLGMDNNLGMGPGLDFPPNAPNLGAPGLSPSPFEMPAEKPDFGFARPANLNRDEVPPEARNAPAFGGAFAPQSAQQAQQGQTASTHEMQVIYAKLDAIRAMLDTIDQRIKTIERIEETKERDRSRW